MILFNRFNKFIITGLGAALVNILFMVLFVEVLYFRNSLLKNIANILAIFLSIIYNFIICRLWTWNDIPKKYGKGLLLQFISFNVVNLIMLALRTVLFAIFEKIGMYYLLNVIIGIAIAAIFSFTLYDKIVFKNLGNRNV